MSSIQEFNIYKYAENILGENLDSLAVEEPLEIVLNYTQDGVIASKPISITMRTPGDDSNLAIGFLFTESIIESNSSIERINSSIENKIIVSLKQDTMFDIEKLKRNFYTSSSCGVCGKASLDALKTIQAPKKENLTLIVNKDILLGLKNKINSLQSNFSQTGGIHASALFDTDGHLLSLFEDVGRHNALDKLIGHYVLHNQTDLSKYILLLSGRASFELIQKAAMANLKMVCAIGAPSSLAVELAREFDITLIGFLKNESFNIYHHPNRIQF